MTDSGKKWRQGMLRRFSKSSQDAKRLTYLLLCLLRHGFGAKVFETSLDEIQAFYSAAFGSAFQLVNMQEELTDVGILNRLIFTPEDSLTKQHVHTINSLLTPEMLGLRAEDLKIQTDSKQMVSHMFDKRMFDQLRFLDEISHENFGIKKFENGLGSFAPDKRLFGRHENYVAISPLFLEEIRDNLHSLKQARVDKTESLIESVMFRTVNQSWTQCKIDFIKLKRERALWRLDKIRSPQRFGSNCNRSERVSGNSAGEPQGQTRELPRTFTNLHPESEGNQSRNSCWIAIVILDRDY